MQTDISEFKLLMFVLVREVPSKGKGSSGIDPSVAEVGMQKPSLCEMIVMIMMIAMSDNDGDDVFLLMMMRLMMTTQMMMIIIMIIIMMMIIMMMIPHRSVERSPSSPYR